ncbi:hypothetical protein AMP9_0302 [plant metagenome]|uniref:Uncharacterized protein n=1 Tax=plant metagenome TaxID=1297885 RepID=A0A484NUF4_9ZZZZ
MGQGDRGREDYGGVKVPPPRRCAPPPQGGGAGGPAEPAPLHPCSSFC